MDIVPFDVLLSERVHTAFCPFHLCRNERSNVRLNNFVMYFFSLSQMQVSESAFYGSVQNILSFHLICELMPTKVHGTLILSGVLNGYKNLSLKLRTSVFKIRVLRRTFGPLWDKGTKD